MARLDFLQSALATGSLAHAYLLYGNDAALQKKAALQCMQILLCAAETAAERPCAQCRGCKAVELEAHPDLVHISGEEGDEIKIADIRGIAKTLQLAPYEAQRKIVIVENAHLMNTAAQSAFLKVLEEPTGQALIMLATRYPARLLTTIRSRAQPVPLYRFAALATQKKEVKQAAKAEFDELGRKLLVERFAYAKKLAEHPEQAAATLEEWLAYARINLLEALGSESAGKELLARKRIVQKLQDVLFYVQGTNVNVRLAIEQIMLTL